jgi:manganese efflux pump family protein
LVHGAIRMNFITILILAIGLCFDTFAVSVSCGLSLNRIAFLQATRFAFMMAFFQGLNPFIGWFAGNGIVRYIRDFDHWIAFALLTIIGIRMIIDSLSKVEKRNFNPTRFSTMLMLALATSIDALIVGVSLAFTNVNIYWACFIIGSVTFIASMLGILFGKKTGERFSKRLEVAGGLVLILIGLKILMDHLVAS